MTGFKNLFDRPPDHVLTWEVILREGLHSLPAATRGLVLVVRGDEILYVGRSRRLPRFVGNFISALFSGVGEHERPGGARIHAAGVPPKDIEFRFYYGSDEYIREYEVIATFEPPYNRKFRRRPDGQWDDRVQRAAIAGTPEGERAERTEFLRSILEGPRAARARSSMPRPW